MWEPAWGSLLSLSFRSAKAKLLMLRYKGVGALTPLASPASLLGDCFGCCPGLRRTLKSLQFLSLPVSGHGE